MFIGRIKKTDPKFTIAIALLFMVCLCIILFRTKIIVGQLKNKGDAAYKEGIFGDAEMYYGKALKKAPGQYVTRFNLGNAYYKQQRYGEAFESYKQALKAGDDSLKAAAWYNLGNVFYKQNQLQQSATAYKNALIIAKSNAKARQNLLFVLAKLEGQRVKIIPVLNNNNQQAPDKKDNQAASNKKETPGEKSSDKNTTGEQKISDKAVDDIFKTLKQNEDDARAKIGSRKRAPTAIKSTEPDY
jgi:Ca-activated chloride channel family protein